MFVVKFQQEVMERAHSTSAGIIREVKAESAVGQRLESVDDLCYGAT